MRNRVRVIACILVLLMTIPVAFACSQAAAPTTSAPAPTAAPTKAPTTAPATTMAPAPAPAPATTAAPAPTPAPTTAPATTSAAAKDLKLGLMVPLSGGSAPWGIRTQKGAQMAADEINAAGGVTVGGQKYNVKIVAWDNVGTAAGGTAAAEKLVYDEKVFSISNSINTAACLAAKVVTEPNKVMFFTSAIAADLGNTPWDFIIWSSPQYQAAPTGKWVLKNYPTVKNVALFVPNDATGQSNIASYQSQLPPLGFKIVDTETYSRGSLDYYGTLYKIMSTHPDIMWVGSSPPADLALMLKQAHEIGWKGLVVWDSGDMLDQIIQIAGPDAAENLIGITYMDYQSDKAPQTLKDYVKKWQAISTDPPGAMDSAGYMTPFWIVDAIKKTNSLDPTTVRDAIIAAGKAGQLGTPYGMGKLTGKDFYGMDTYVQFPVSFAMVKGGKVVGLGTLPTD